MKKRGASFDGPMRKVVYIFEREGDHGGALWLLVLECGHSVTKPRYNAKSLTAFIRAMFRPIEEKLAPKRARCFMCGVGHERYDPALLIKAFGG